MNCSIHFIILILLLRPLPGVGEVRYRGGPLAEEVDHSKKWSCEKIFEKYNCQEKIDKAGIEDNPNFISCNKNYTTALKATASCAGVGITTYGVGYLTALAPELAIPIFGAVALYGIATSEQDCYYDNGEGSLKDDWAKPLEIIHNKKYADTMKATLSCIDLQALSRSTVESHLSTIHEKILMLENYERDLERMPHNKERLERRYPYDERTLTTKEKELLKLVEKQKAREDKLKSSIRKLNETHHCRSVEWKLKVVCGAVGAGVAGKIARVPKPKPKANPKSGSAFSRWRNRQRLIKVGKKIHMKFVKDKGRDSDVSLDYRKMGGEGTYPKVENVTSQDQDFQAVNGFVRKSMRQLEQWKKSLRGPNSQADKVIGDALERLGWNPNLLQTHYDDAIMMSRIAYIVDHNISAPTTGWGYHSTTTEVFDSILKYGLNSSKGTRSNHGPGFSSNNAMFGGAPNGTYAQGAVDSKGGRNMYLRFPLNTQLPKTTQAHTNAPVPPEFIEYSLDGKTWFRMIFSSP